MNSNKDVLVGLQNHSNACSVAVKVRSFQIALATVLFLTRKIICSGFLLFDVKVLFSKIVIFSIIVTVVLWSYVQHFINSS